MESKNYLKNLFRTLETKVFKMQNYMIFNIIGGSGFVGSSLINEFGKENCFNIDKNQSLFHSEITKIAI